MGFPKKQKKFRHIIHVYVPEEFQGDVEEAQKIAKREGESLSQKTVKFWVDYKKLHAHGNPQTLLPKFGIQTKITQQCEYPGCSLTAAFECVPTSPLAKPKVFYCKEHREHAEQNRLLKKSKKL